MQIQGIRSEMFVVYELNLFVTSRCDFFLNVAKFVIQQQQVSKCGWEWKKVKLIR